MNCLTVLTMAFVFSVMPSCSKDDTNNNKEEMKSNDSESSTYEKKMMAELTGTSWNFDSWTYNNKSKSAGGILTFAGNNTLYYIDFRLNDSYITSKGYWYFSEDELTLLPGEDTTTDQRAAFMASMGVNHSIEKLTSNEMILESLTRDDVRHFKKVSYQEGGGGGGGSSSGNIPYVLSFDYTSTKTSITVKFTCSERPTDATVRYGTTSASNTISSSIAGLQVSATATGLKAGTKYYFKCTVKNSYGSSTSDEYPVMTNY